MNTKKKTIKRLIGGTAVCSTLLVAGVGAVAFNTPKLDVHAYNADSTKVEISNSNFNSNTSSSFPFSPNSYTAFSNGKKVENGDSVKTNATAGVIDLTNEKYATKFALAKRDHIDKYVLMIDSSKEDADKDEVTYHSVNYEYRNTSTLTLEANSRYMFSVDVFTVTNSECASLFLYNDKGEVFSSIEKVSSLNTWTTYTFFVATNNIEGTTVTLGMALDGAGTVLFDNLAGAKLSETQYEYNIDKLEELETSGHLPEGSYVEYKKIDNVLKTFTINSSGALVGSPTDLTDFTQTEYEFNDKSTKVVVEDTDGTNNYAIKLSNSEKTYSTYQTNKVFEFGQNRIFKVNVTAKVGNLDGKANLTLKRVNADGTDFENTDHNKTISITSNTTSSSTASVTNDYKTYSFLINSHSSEPVHFKLQFGLGNTETLTVGDLFISEIEISKINYSTYNSASTGSGIEKINFVDAYSSSSIMLDNGDFNAFEIQDYNAPLPAVATNWTATTGSGMQHYGVVNTSTFDADISGLNLSNPHSPSSDNNNVLMMYNAQKDSLSYTSNSKLLSADSYHKFEIDVQSQNAPVRVALVAKKDDKEFEICSKEINTQGIWETVTLFVHAGQQDLSVSLKLTLNSTSYGYAFADNAKFDFLKTADQLKNEFNATESSAFTVIADMADIISSGDADNFATPTYFEKPNVDGVEAGTITLNSANIGNVITENYIEEFNSIAKDGKDKKAIGIRSFEDVAFTTTSKLGYALKTGDDKYYKISVSVFTQGLGANNSETDLSKIGAGFKLTGFDNAFIRLKSENKWTTYSFYIQADAEKTAYLEFCLGNEEAKTKGSAFFADVTFDSSVTKEEFDSVVEDSFTKIVKAETKADDDTTEGETETNEEKEKTPNTTWIYLIPGLLTALAILIAIAGLLARKVNWKKIGRRSKAKSTYDRSKTVSVQFYTRKATSLREEKIRELNKDLETINNERKQFEEQYKVDITRLREMKIKRANPQEIAKLEKDLKKNQKMSASLGMTTNRISDELKFVQTETYLNSLVKKLERENAGKLENNQNEENK